MQTNILATMGQSNSIDLSVDYKISKNLEPKLDLAHKIGENMLNAIYRDNENLQKVTAIVKKPSKAKNRALDSPWRERFNSTSFDENDLHYMDDRLMIQKIIQAPMKNSRHWKHPDRDQMLMQVIDIW